ncbi:MAG: hypothetical protein V1798_09200 [Pseudomonadota bacterium]
MQYRYVLGFVALVCGTGMSVSASAGETRETAVSEICPPDKVEQALQSNPVYSKPEYKTFQAKVTPMFAGTRLPSKVRARLGILEPPALPKAGGLPGLGGSPIGIGDIVNLLAKFWDILINNQPVIRTGLPPQAEAIPSGITDWRDLEWPKKEPKVYGFKVEAVNGLHMKPVQVTYFISYTWGGKYQGHGQYLKNVLVVPGDIKVLSLYHVDLSAKVLDPTNYGTKKDPIAGLQIVVSHRICTVIQDGRWAQVYQVQGDGGFAAVTPATFSGLAE